MAGLAPANHVFLRHPTERAAHHWATAARLGDRPPLRAICAAITTHFFLGGSPQRYKRSHSPHTKSGCRRRRAMRLASLAMVPRIASSVPMHPSFESNKHTPGTGGGIDRDQQALARARAAMRGAPAGKLT